METPHGKWSAAELTLLRSGASTREIQAKYPHRTRRSIESQRYLERKAGRMGRASLQAPAPSDELDRETDWESRWAHLEQANEISEVLSTTTEVAHWNSPDPHLPIGIVFIGDIHAGAAGVRYDLLRRDMEILRDTEGLYGICLGDILENTKPQSKSGNALYDVLFSKPREQLLYAQARMKIATGKWIAVCQGNHDAWDGRWSGIDRLPELAENLGATYFTEGGGTVFAHIGGQRYTIIVRHNVGGNSRINTSNAQRRTYDEFNQWERADVVCIAHFHYNDLHQPARNGRDVVWFRCGTYKTTDHYSQSGGFNPEYGCPLVILYPDERVLVPYRGNNWVHGLRFLEAERERYRQMSA